MAVWESNEEDYQMWIKRCLNCPYIDCINCYENRNLWLGDKTREELEALINPDFPILSEEQWGGMSLVHRRIYMACHDGYAPKEIAEKLDIEASSVYYVIQKYKIPKMTSEERLARQLLYGKVPLPEE